MRKFIKKIALVGLILIVLSVIFDIYISSKLKKSKTFAKGEMAVWNDIYKGNINSNIVIYGSSRAWTHFDPELISRAMNKSCYNLGIDGHSFWLQYLRHKEYIRYNTKPELIILSVDFFSLQRRADLYNLEQFLPYVFNDNVRKFTESYIGYSWFDYKIPLIRYYGKKKSLKESLKKNTKINNEKPIREKGYRGKDQNWNNDFDIAKKKLDYFEIVLDTSSISLFDKFLEETKQNNINVILVYSPEYIEGQKFAKNRDSVIKLFQEFALKYNIQFLDYSNNKICFEKDNFFNATHLNKRGAEKFTREFVIDLQQAIDDNY